MMTALNANLYTKRLLYIFLYLQRFLANILIMVGWGIFWACQQTRVIIQKIEDRQQGPLFLNTQFTTYANENIPTGCTRKRVVSKNST